MNPHNPHDRRGAAHRGAKEAAMDTYTVRVPRWPILLRLLGRDPLVRTTDRVHTLISVLTVVVTLLAAPIAAAIGAEVYDSRRDVYAELVTIRDTVTATVTDVPASQQIVDTKTITVEGRWSAAGTEHTGAVMAPSTVEAGDAIEIWVDDNGAQVPAPTPSTRAAVEALTVALLIWVGFAAAASSVLTLTGAACDRIRFHWMATRDGNTTSTPWSATATCISDRAARRNGNAAQGNPIRRHRARVRRGDDREQRQRFILPRSATGPRTARRNGRTDGIAPATRRRSPSPCSKECPRASTGQSLNRPRANVAQ